VDDANRLHNRYANADSHLGYADRVRCLVTGAAGFIGSHLAERLVRNGHLVRGLDSFVPYYPREVKNQNLRWLLAQPDFEFHESDLRIDALDAALDAVEVIFHLAAMPGLAASWIDFEAYMTCNVLATQRLVEAARQSASLRAFVHASTSSVYGRDALGDESSGLCPVSPYGVTKLAAEKLVQAYHDVYGLPSVVLRYFSVYGPRQRPDMGTHIFIDHILDGTPISVFGDGEQTRGQTFVADCVAATILAAERGQPGDVYNIGGGDARSVNWVIDTLAELVGRRAEINHAPTRPGDQRDTLADTTRARQVLGFVPGTPLRDGLAAQVEWQRAHRLAHA
jgi:nucleoside-diphosphate-sugar epimerase